MKKIGKKFWLALVLFGLAGQVAWVVENMYLNVFLYKMFRASAADISIMVSASAVAATVTTILMGALTDRIGKRKVFICAGYIVWGISILGFGLLRMDVLTPLCGGVAEAMALGISLVIMLDCVMTFFGSTANDAAYNAWITDAGDESNRGKIEGINAMMPLVAILVVFGGFMGFDLDVADSWSTIYAIIGGLVLLLGIAGFFLVEEVPLQEKAELKTSYWYNLSYSFRFQTIKENKLLYAVVGAFALFGISIQTFMPYLILYYEQTLQMDNYVLVMAPAIILASVATVFYGRLYDMLGFQKSVLPCMGMLIGGYIILYFTVGTFPVFLGSLLMMCGYLCGMAVFGAVIRARIPEQMAGRFQGLRILGQVLIPGVIGPAIGAFVLRDAAQIENQDGTFSFLPDRGIWMAATVAALVVLVALEGIWQMIRRGHYELLTEAAEQGELQGAWKKHPRPQMKRDTFYVLDKDWKLDGNAIKVPFPPQSVLSGYKEKIRNVMIYETKFDFPQSFTLERVLLHFGAVDQCAEVWVNEQPVGKHEGGYLAFTIDITDVLNREGTNSLRVKITDKLSRKYPYGKQCKKRGGMWYTPVSGIWQTVWLENVPGNYLKNIRLKPDASGVEIAVETKAAGFRARIMLDNGEMLEASFEGRKGYINLENHVDQNGNSYEPRFWSPEDPYLYAMEVFAGEDRVETYFALRTVDIREIEGVRRVCLNGNPIFFHGVLDQGYYSDGIYLPAEEEEYERDILRMKELGFNMLRKHIKVEPEWFYYYCDKHGMLVMQDMVNNGGYSFLRDTALPTIGMKSRKDNVSGRADRKAIFKEHTTQTIRQLYNHPCIVAYTIFNEGWGQFDSDEMYDYVKGLDDTRLIDSTSGWFWQEKSDFDSEHIYFKTIDLEVKERPLFVSECGGYSRVIDNHYYSIYNTYGYGSATDEDDLTNQITEMYHKMILPGIPKGVCGCIYTQLSDVEDEVNGLYTYDRKVCKVNVAKMKQLGEELKG